MILQVEENGETSSNRHLWGLYAKKWQIVYINCPSWGSSKIIEPQITFGTENMCAKSHQIPHIYLQTLP